MASQFGLFSLQLLDSDGTPLEGGRVYTYAAGTTTHKAVYTETSGTVAHTYTSDGAGGLYITLNARGELPAPMFGTAGAYDIALKTAAGATVWTRRAEVIDDSSATAAVDALEANLSGTGAGQGAPLVGRKHSAPGAVASTLDAELNSALRLHAGAHFGVVGDGTTDDTTALQAAITAAATLRRTLVIAGTPLVSAKITFPQWCSVEFDGPPGNFSGQLPASYIIKKSTMTTAAVDVAGQSVCVRGGGVIGQAGNTGDNIHIRGNSVRWEHGYSQGAGAHGWRIGEDATTVPNTNRFILTGCGAASNTGNGFHIHDGDAPGSAPNANAGILISPFAISNGGHGLYANNSFGNTVTGILSETNGGKGVYLDERCVSMTFIGGDIEMNTGGAGTTGSDLVLVTSIIAAGGQKGGNTFIGVNIGTPPTDNGWMTSRGWTGFDGFGTASGPGTINGEGTCTLTIAGTTTAGVNTYSQQVGRFTKKGREVTVFFDLALSGNTTPMAGNLCIEGLPFSAVSGTGSGCVAWSLISVLTFPASTSMLLMSVAGTRATLQAVGSGTSFLGVPVANIGASTGRLAGTLTYMTAAS